MVDEEVLAGTGSMEWKDVEDRRGTPPDSRVFGYADLCELLDDLRHDMLPQLRGYVFEYLP